MVVADGRGAEALIAELVLAESGEFLWRGLEDGGDAALAGDVNARVGHDGRAIEFAIDFFVPALLASGGFPADGATGITDGEDMAVFDEHGRHIGLRDILPCDLARAIGFERHGVILWITAAEEDAAAVGHGGDDGLLGAAVDAPEFRAGERVKALHLVAACKHGLDLACGCEDGGSGIIGHRRAILLPHDLASEFVEAGHLASAAMIGGDEHHVLINDRRRTKALMHLEITHAALPELLAFQIERCVAPSFKKFTNSCSPSLTTSEDACEEIL